MARRKYSCKKLSTAAKRKAISNWRSQTGRRGAKRGCKLVVFGRRGCRSGVAVERCNGRKLSTSAKRRYRRMKRRGEICTRKRGRRKLFSSRC